MVKLNSSVARSARRRIVVAGVNPFEDLPGYQFVSLMRSNPRYDIIAADDNEAALTVLNATGFNIRRLPHPTIDPTAFISQLVLLADDVEADAILPGADAHLSTLAKAFSENTDVKRLCPWAEWISDAGLFDKLRIQEWLSAVGRTPRRVATANEADLLSAGRILGYPFVLKGIRKGAKVCQDHLEVQVALRELMKNPANGTSSPAVYAEQWVDGEEHCLLVFGGCSPNLEGRTASIRKLAATQLGTTVAGITTDELPTELDLEQLQTCLPKGAFIEIEWRKDSDGCCWLFEANLRLPSWIGALPSFGRSWIQASVEAANDWTRSDGGALSFPAPGELIYRLPQAGPLALTDAFRGSGRGDGLAPEINARRPPMVWAHAAPHSFFAK